MVPGTGFTGAPWLIIVGPENEQILQLQTDLRRMYKVARVDDLEAAALAIEQQRFQVLLYMLTATDLDDWSVVGEFSSTGTPPIVVVGEGMDPPRIAELYLAGISDYVQAPVTLDEVKEAVERVLAGE